jgi:hypothetical protein
MLLDNDNDYERYMRLRTVSKKLGAELTRLLHKKEIYRCGKELGLLREKTLIFDNENDVAVLMDYCIHNPSGKKSCIDLYMERSSLDPVSDEIMVLKALRESFYSIFQVDRTEKSYLTYAKDILWRRSIVVIDVGFGSSAPPGVLIAARLMKMPATDYYMTTGGPMVVQEKHAIDAVSITLSAFSESIERGDLSLRQASAIGKRITRVLLQQENKNMMLAEPSEHERALRNSDFHG